MARNVRELRYHGAYVLIGIDGRCWLNRRGYGRYTRNLLKALARRDDEDRYSPSSSVDTLFPLLRPARALIAIPLVVLGAAAWTFPPHDVTALAAALRALLGDATRRRRRAAARLCPRAQKRVELTS